MSAPHTAATSSPSTKESLTPFLMSSPPAVDMVALASAADAPFDSQVPFADLGNEAIVTIESASPCGSPRAVAGSPLPHTTTVTTSTQTAVTPSAADLESFFALDASFLALAATPSSPISTSSSTAATTAGTVSPLALKLESPLLASIASPATATTTTRGSATKTAATPAKRARTATSTGHRKRAVDPADKEARARERVLRNRAAAQESRDKKRKYVAEIEASNAQLQQENSQLLKRLKTVEEDNQTLSKRLEALTAQFEKMQQQLAMNSGIQHNHPGVGFCQSAVLAKKDGTQVSTNSLQQKLAPPPKKNLSRTFLSTSKTPSMTIPSAATTKRYPSRAAPYPSRQARRQSSEEICSRPFRNNSDQTLTLSSSAPPCLLRLGTAEAAILTQLLPQLMLTSLILFWISTGMHSSSSSNTTTSSFFLNFLRHQQLLNPQRPFSNSAAGQAKNSSFSLTTTTAAAAMSGPTTTAATAAAPSMIHVSKDVITSLSPACVQEILTEFRQGRKDNARRLLLKVLLSSAKRQW